MPVQVVGLLKGLVIMEVYRAAKGFVTLAFRGRVVAVVNNIVTADIVYQDREVVPRVMGLILLVQDVSALLILSVIIATEVAMTVVMGAWVITVEVGMGVSLNVMFLYVSHAKVVTVLQYMAMYVMLVINALTVILTAMQTVTGFVTALVTGLVMVAVIQAVHLITGHAQELVTSA